MSSKTSHASDPVVADDPGCAPFATFDEFSVRLIAWQRRAGRHALPWQNTRDPYRVWLSEIMLQQTQVAAVEGYYGRFLSAFPDVRALASASADAVMAQWAGLGYYSRARNLHRCAQIIVAEHGGEFPCDPEKLASLPGIGRSTAAAIAAFAFGARAAILDGNVKRVLARVFGVDGYPGSGPVEKRMWALAEALLPAREIEAYTQGLMDLGATLCVRARPACLSGAADCPMSDRCVARRDDRVLELPVPKPTRALPERRVVMLLIRNGRSSLLQRRPDSGIWGGLWSLPEVGEGEPDDWLAHARLEPWLVQRGMAGARIRAVSALPAVRHVFTHFRLQIFPVRVELEQDAVTGLLGETGVDWIEDKDLAAYGMPVPIARLLKMARDG